MLENDCASFWCFQLHSPHWWSSGASLYPGMSRQEWGRPRSSLLCSAFSLQNLQEAKAVSLQGFLLHIMWCGFPVENIWLEGMSCIEPLEYEEFGNLFFLHSSVLTLQKKSNRKERLFVISWGYYLLYLLFTEGGCDRLMLF